MFWVFVFVVSCITTFLMVMYNTRKEELKKFILSTEVSEKILPSDEAETVDNELKNLSVKLTEKEYILKDSRCRIQNAEMTLNDIDSKNASIRDRYKTLMVELKNDLAKTECEYNGLLDQVASISQRREDLKNDVREQQKMLVNFSKHLENREETLSEDIVDRSNRAKLRGNGKVFGIMGTRIIQNSRSDAGSR